MSGRAYRQLLSDRAALSFSIAGFVARLPLSMTGIGIILLVSLASGSFGRAGLVTAAATVTAAVIAPMSGKLMDRFGQARVLLFAATAYAASVSLLVVSVLSDWPLAVSIAAAVGIGIGFPSSGSAVRARWSRRLDGTPLLGTAFAVEAVFDEMVFIIGPVLVTYLATAIHPGAGLGVAVAIGLVGTVALAAQRSTEPEIVPFRQADGARDRLPIRVLVPVGLASAALGAVFGGMEVTVVAFARDAGVLGYTGLILMAWAFGSLLAGAVTGAITWRVDPAVRLRRSALVMGLCVVPLLFVDNPWLIALGLLVSGMAIAPTMIATTAVVQARVPASRLTESLAWMTTGMAAGVALGAAVGGRLIDSSGWWAGFASVAGAGAALILLAQFVRNAPSGRPHLTPGQPDTAPAAPTPPLAGSPQW